MATYNGYLETKNGSIVEYSIDVNVGRDEYPTGYNYKTDDIIYSYEPCIDGWEIESVTVEDDKGIKTEYNGKDTIPDDIQQAIDSDVEHKESEIIKEIIDDSY